MLASLILSWTLLSTQAAPPGETLLLQQPTISAEHVVFVYADDLWIGSRSGGEARRLTSSPGLETQPRLSPDGQWVAFSGQYEGNTDVYIISILGGSPRRMTWHPGMDVVNDWHPTGSSILFTSSRESNTPTAKLFTVPVAGGPATALAIPRASRGGFDSTGKRIAFTPYWDAFRTWKRYRGGRVNRVWLFDRESQACEEIPHAKANDTWPVWIGDRVYFASDRDGTMNLWQFDPGSKAPTQVTRFDGFDIRNLTAGAGTIVFERAGAIHVFDPASGNVQRLRFRLLTDGLARTPRWEKVEGMVRSAALAPNGKRVAFEARGEIVTLPREHGDPRDVTRSPGAHDRSPVWSPDGKTLAWFSDQGETFQDREYRLWTAPADGTGEAKSFDLGGGGFYYWPRFSPDGKHVLFQDKANRLAFVTLESSVITEVYRSQGSLGVVFVDAAWSADSKWIAFEERNERTLYDQLALFRLTDGTITTITDGFGEAGNPAFSDDGKHLFFTASVNVGPQLFGLNMNSSASRDFESGIYAVVLQKDAPNPLAPKNDLASDDEESSEEDADGDADGSKSSKSDTGDDDSESSKGDPDEEVSKKSKTAKSDLPAIDLDGIDQRILALPIDSGNYGGLHTAGDKLLFVDYSGEGRGGALHAFDFDSREAKSLRSGVGSIEVSRDGKSLLLRLGRKFVVTNAEAKEDKSLPIDSHRVYVVPEEEWAQILHEAWRIHRDYFYDSNMHGIDWPKMWQRWSAFLPHVQHRSELGLITRELSGELACGHNYERGGDFPDRPTDIGVGLLGADYEVVGDRYRIRRIYRGQNWNRRLRAPLTEPGIDVREGDFLLRVNGREVSAEMSLYSYFQGLAGRRVSIEVSGDSDGSEPRRALVTPVGSEFQLRRLSWVEANRKRVDELSGGRLAYIYMPNTAGAGQAAFDRDYYSQLHKKGLIIDERFNGGGQVADYVVNVLSRDVLSYWMNRERWVGRSPFETMPGPKVMVINESAGSGGDWMPWAFREMKLGPLVGTRTWGGLVGISGYPTLVDGGSVTSASFGVMDRDGKWIVENVGVAPDHEVFQWPTEVIAGRDPQLEKAVELAIAALKQAPAERVPTYSPPIPR